MKSVVCVCVCVCSLAELSYSTNPNITVVMRMTTVAVIRCLDQFQLGKDDFDCYIERIKQYFIANEEPLMKQVTKQLEAQLTNC